MAESVGEESLATIASMLIASPGDVWKWCLVCRMYRSAFRSFKIWEKVLHDIHWPPRFKKSMHDDAGDKQREAVLHAYEYGLGGHCRNLVVDVMFSAWEDLSTLSYACPKISHVTMTGIGARGVDSNVWKAWSQTMETASLAFFYDAVDGPPAIRETLSDVLCSCSWLQELRLHGLDWKNARENCLSVLCRSKCEVPKLRRLALFGAAASLVDNDLLKLTRLRPGLVVYTTVQDLPNLDW